MPDQNWKRRPAMLPGIGRDENSEDSREKMVALRGIEPRSDG